VGQFGLQIFNLIDSLSGCLLLTFGIYLKINLSSDFTNANIQWIGISTIVLGSLLLGVSSLCFCGIVASECRRAILASGYLSLIASIYSFCCAVAALIVRPQFNHFINSHADELNLSSNETDFIQQFFFFLAFGMFYLSISCFIRFQTCRKMYANTVQVDGEFGRLLDAENQRMDDEHEEKREQIYNKYDNLRDHYRQKYVKSNPTDSSSKI
jgi:hypothetical protein